MVCRSGLGGEQMTTEEAKSAAGDAPQKDVQGGPWCARSSVP